MPHPQQSRTMPWCPLGFVALCLAIMGTGCCSWHHCSRGQAICDDSGACSGGVCQEGDHGPWEWEPGNECGDECQDASCEHQCHISPLWERLLALGGCGQQGCGDVYWHEFHSDPPDCCDPCDEYGNWTGGCGPYRAPYRMGAFGPPVDAVMDSSGPGEIVFPDDSVVPDIEPMYETSASSPRARSTSKARRNVRRR
jgi:hypothetical protein